MSERWKDIAGYEGYYKVSDKGRVMSCERYARVCGGAKRLVKQRILKQYQCVGGYWQVNLNKDGKSVPKLIHRLVAEAFIDNPNSLPQVNHKDENINNNCVFNLEWCTAKYNANYGTRNVRMMECRETKQVDQFTLDGKHIKRWNSMMDAQRGTGADVSAIIRVCKGKQRTSLGYIWRYAE